jgi:drug/metabolite transporter (DMT)-like permease
MYTNKRKGLLIVILGVTILSLDSLLVRLAGTTNWNILFWRGILMFISVGTICIFRRKTSLPGDKKTWIAALCSAIFFGLGGTFFVTSIMHTKVANAVVLISASPLFAAIFTRMFRIDKIGLRTWLAIGIALCGVIAVFSGSLRLGAGVKGDIIALLAACLLGGNLTLLRLFNTLDRFLLISVGGLVMMIVAFPCAAPLHLPMQTYVVVAVMGLVQMPAALILIAQSTKYLPSPEVSLFLLIETILAPIWVWLFIGEIIPESTFLGGGIILMTIVWHSWAGMRELHKVQKNIPIPNAKD